uniref:Profilin n=1 Tax=Schistosoma japonicum TaxID=6182 RepID=C1LAS8_SCHJA|nr:hypothetical protein [Schistosoma japonicum]
MSADSWDNHCVTYVANNKCLKNLCMTAIDGSHLGTSNPDFRIPPELILQLKSILDGGLDTSIFFMGEKYIVLQHDSSCLCQPMWQEIPYILCYRENLLGWTDCRR